MKRILLVILWLVCSVCAGYGQTGALNVVGGAIDLRTITVTMNASQIIALWSGVCNASSLLSGAGTCVTVSSGFDQITSGTNTAAAMVVGAGASLDYTSTGTIDANRLGAGTIKVGSGIIYPATDSTTAIQFMKADGTTPVAWLDSNQLRFVVNPTGTPTGNRSFLFKTGIQEVGGRLHLYEDGSNLGTIVLQGYNRVFLHASNNGNISVGPTYVATGTGTFEVYDATASTGITREWIREGAGQSTNEAWGVYANDGTTSRVSVANGLLSVAQLKTTGSAGTKKVVCVDTATGILYASSTTTDCSN